MDRLIHEWNGVRFDAFTSPLRCPDCGFVLAPPYLESLTWAWGRCERCETDAPMVPVVPYVPEPVEIVPIRPKPGRAGLSLRLRFLVLRRDGYRCQLCGRGASDGVSLEIDHKRAVARGGPTALDNLWTLCFDCNRGKGTDEL